ncbi:chemotaxis protein CheB [Marinilabiliaceae bacterium ANBcel2]|nr:chemotaxis protein CheB [Marinilabiliaceae bacterium ANBcel2]
MPNNNHYFKAIVMGGSAGSFSVISNILSKIRPDFKPPIILSLHRLKHVRSGLVEGLSLKSKIKVIEPNDKEKLSYNNVYLAPSNYHLFIEIDGSISLSTEESYNHSRPSIDYTLSSAAYVYRDKILGILLTGANKDGAKGLKDIHDKRGFTIIQDPSTCDIDTMPKEALKLFKPNKVFSPDQIVEFLNSLPQ